MTAQPTLTTEVVPTSQNGSAQAHPRPLVAQTFGLTDKGKVRATNEDQFVTATLMRALWIEQSSIPQSQVHYGDKRGHLLIVADGMGGVQGGEKASALAVGAIEEFLLNALRWLLVLDGVPEASVLRDFKEALRSADACVYAAAAGTVGFRGMGTTLTLAYSFGAELFVAHVGDSRCYLQRNGVLVQLTHDHTLIREMVEKGLLLPEAAAAHPFRHIITNVVGGTEPGLRVEVHRVGLEPGDTLLLCTDGLTGMLPDERIGAVLTASPTPAAACEELVKLANEQGGKDNVTVVVARYS